MNNYELLKNNKDITRCKDCRYGYESYLHKPCSENKVYFCNLATDAISTYRMMYPDEFCSIGSHHECEKPGDDCNFTKLQYSNIGVVHCKDCVHCCLEREEADSSPDGYWDTYYCELLPQCRVVVHGCDFCSSGALEQNNKEEY